VKITVLRIVEVLLFFLIVAILLLLPVIRSTSVCVVSITTKMQQSFTEAKKLQTRQERRDNFCQDDEVDFKQLLTCVSQSKTKSYFYSIVINKYFQIRGTLTNIVETHNTLCPNNQISYP
jgi:hypothetical protein